MSGVRQSSRKRAAFLDTSLERRLDRRGFVVVRGLALEQLSWLAAISDESPPRWTPPPPADPDHPEKSSAGQSWRRQMAPGADWRIGVDQSSSEERLRLEQTMAPFWKRLLESVLDDHRIVFTSFLVKHASPDSVLPLHQDPTFVDERQYRALTVWIALDDISARLDNGPLHVIPGSHLAGAEIRGTHTEPTYISELAALWPLTRRVDVQAGDAVIMDGRVLHGSPPNRSGLHRRALTGVVAPREAELCHAVGTVDDQVEILRVDDSFYWRHSPRSLREQVPTDHEVVATVPRASHPITADALLATCRRGRWRRRT